MSLYRGIATIFAACMGLSSAATAADLYGSVKDVPEYIPPAITWTGLYVGVHGGYVWNDVNSVHAANNWWTTAPGQNFPSSLDGAALGLQLGYNYQVGRWVVGGEVSYSVTFGDEADASPYFPALDSYSAELDGIFLATGRLGYDFASGTLVYVKGGYAGARIEVSNDDFVSGNTNLSIDKGWYNGWTIGGGIEQRLGTNVSLALEYNYIDLGRNTVSMTNTGPNVGGTTIITNVDPDVMHTFMARLNLKLGNY